MALFASFRKDLLGWAISQNMNLVSTAQPRITQLYPPARLESLEAPLSWMRYNAVFNVSRLPISITWTNHCFSLIAQATRLGIVCDQSNVLVATDFVSTNEGTYSVIVDHPDVATSQQTVVQGNMLSTTKVNETMSRPATKTGNATSHRSLADLYSSMDLDTPGKSSKTGESDSRQSGPEQQNLFNAKKFFDQMEMPPPQDDVANSQDMMVR